MSETDIPSSQKVLVVGATGATGRHLVQHLLDRGLSVKVIVRSKAGLLDSSTNHPNLTIIEAPVLDLSAEKLQEYVGDCQAVASCLGHNMTFRGVFGPPYRLVTRTMQRLCEAIRESKPQRPVKVLLMNTSGNRNHDLNETVSFAEKCVVGLIRLLIPPHADNEDAANFLRTSTGQADPAIQWVAIRPDGLIDATEVSPYDTYPSPIRSAIFDAGKVSRINVAHFMAELITDEPTWQNWVGQMPVIYNNSQEN